MEAIISLILVIIIGLLISVYRLGVLKNKGLIFVVIVIVMGVCGSVLGNILFSILNTMLNTASISVSVSGSILGAFTLVKVFIILREKKR